MSRRQGGILTVAVLLAWPGSWAAVRAQAPAPATRQVIAESPRKLAAPTVSAGPLTPASYSVTTPPPAYPPPAAGTASVYSTCPSYSSPACSTVMAPPACAPFEDSNGPLLRGDPLLDRPGYPAPGWYAALEADIIKPHLKNGLMNVVAVGGMFVDRVHLPSAGLDWTASPRFELGYRLSQGAGELLATYSSLVSQGSELVPGYDLLGTGVLSSRLNVNALELDYASREFSLGDCWDMKWKIGLRMAAVYFDSQANGLLLGQKTSNNFLGLGPHLGLDLRRRLDWPGLFLLGRAESAGQLGRITQSYQETFSLMGRPLVGGATRDSNIQWVPVVRVMAGLGWVPWEDVPVTLSAGYVFEGWWYLGEIQSTGSSASLTANGVFLRAEWNY